MSKTSYKIIKLLGEGSFGKAYLGVSDKDGSNCVIKQIPVEGLSDQEKRETFNEASILKKLDHQNIIKFKEVFLSRKPTQSLNIVTEFADGGDLSQKIEAQKKLKEHFPETQILDYFTQICLALQHMHKKKIIHRDLKSGNVFLMKSGLVKLGDFGISKGFKNTWEKAKTMVGTPYYLSPEIINSKPYDAKSDIWALGVLLYELMTFKMPFEANSLPMLSLKISKGKYPNPPSVYSNELKDILKRCLTLDPEQRPNIDQLLNTEIVKKRIENYLNELNYNKDLTKTMTKKYKENLKENKHKQHKENAQKQGNDTIKEEPKSTTSSTVLKETSKTDTKKMTNDKNKVGDFLKKKKATIKIKPENVQKSSNTQESEKSKNEENVSNFLQVKKGNENVKIDQKSFKEDEIGKTLNAKGYNDLVNKNGQFDVNKMNEDQYNQLRLLNNLNKIANNDQNQDSDESESLSMSTSKESSVIIEHDIDIQNKGNLEKSHEVDDKKNLGKDESKEIEEVKKELLSVLGDDLYKKVHDLVENNTDKTEIKFDKEKLTKKIKEEIDNKAFEQKKIDSAIEKLDELFAIIILERLVSN